jgi:uncharacterized integral membrane protein
MMQTFFRACWWLLGGLVFFTMFAFALNNRTVLTVHWFFGYQSQIQLVLLVLLSLMLGVFLGALAVLPLWWRQYRLSRLPEAEVTPQNAAKASKPKAAAAAATAATSTHTDTGIVDAV